MNRILGVNGIYNWSWSKDSFTDRLLAALGSDERNVVIDVKYPFMTAVLAYTNFAIKRRARKILELNRPGDVLIAHSFGCLIALHAMRMGARFSRVFFFGAAVEPGVEFPREAFTHLYNIHSPDDKALTLGAKLPYHEFGTLGKFGYTGHDPRVHNIKVDGYDHNDYVSARNLCTWANFIEIKLMEAGD